jgi:acetolactate synthase-1/2/3 large subunit
VVTEEVRETLLLLAAAERPLLYLGGGARGAMEALGGELAGLLERMAVPVATSPRAKGIFPEESELSLGVLGRAGSPRAARYLEEGVDVLVVVGSRLEGWERPGSGQMLRARTVVRVDARPVPAGQGPVPRLPVVADAASFLGGLVQHGRTAEPPAAMRVALRRSALLRLRAEVPPVREPARPAAGPSPLPPQRAMAETNPSLRGEVDLYVDAGSCADWATHCLRVSAPARFFLAPRGAAPGWSCGAVIGGKAARPERGAVALVDGAAFLVNGVEVNTATRHGVGAVYLVLSEDGDGSPGCGGLAQLAEALGAAAYRVERAGQLARLLPAALSAAEAEQRPQVIVVRVDHRETLP